MSNEAERHPGSPRVEQEALEIAVFNAILGLRLYRCQDDERTSSSLCPGCGSDVISTQELEKMAAQIARAALRVQAGGAAAAQIIDVVAAVRERGGLYWLCRRNGDGEHGGLEGMWEYPGGKVEPGEQLRQAMVRELCEEFGLEPSRVHVGRVLDSIDDCFSEATGDKVYRVTFFAVAIDEPVALLKHTEARWMTTAEVCAVEHLTSGTIFNARHLSLRGAAVETPGARFRYEERLPNSVYGRTKYIVRADSGYEETLAECYDERTAKILCTALTHESESRPASTAPAAEAGIKLAKLLAAAYEEGWRDHKAGKALNMSERAAPAAPEETKGAICKTHGLAVLMTHVNDGEPCSDYLAAAAPPAPRETEALPKGMATVAERRIQLADWLTKRAELERDRPHLGPDVESVVYLSAAAVELRFMADEPAAIPEAPTAQPDGPREKAQREFVTKLLTAYRTEARRCVLVLHMEPPPVEPYVDMILAALQPPSEPAAGRGLGARVLPPEPAP